MNEADKRIGDDTGKRVWSGETRRVLIKLIDS